MARLSSTSHQVFQQSQNKWLRLTHSKQGFFTASPPSRERNRKTLSAVKSRLQDYDDRCVPDTGSFQPTQWVYVERLSLAANRLGTDSYSKLLSQKMIPNQNTSARTWTWTIDKEGIPNKISSDWASLYPQSETDSTETGSNISTQSEYLEVLPGDAPQ